MLPVFCVPAAKAWPEPDLRSRPKFSTVTTTQFDPIAPSLSHSSTPSASLRISAVPGDQLQQPMPLTLPPSLNVIVPWLKICAPARRSLFPAPPAMFNTPPGATVTVPLSHPPAQLTVDPTGTKRLPVKPPSTFN